VSLGLCDTFNGILGPYILIIATGHHQRLEFRAAGSTVRAPTEVDAPKERALPFQKAKSRFKRRLCARPWLTLFIGVLSDPIFDHVSDLLIIFLDRHSVTTAEQSDVWKVDTRRVSG
jgi:hypothetical protein